MRMAEVLKIEDLPRFTFILSYLFSFFIIYYSLQVDDDQALNFIDETQTLKKEIEELDSK